MCYKIDQTNMLENQVYSIDHVSWISGRMEFLLQQESILYLYKEWFTCEKQVFFLSP